MQRYLIAQSAPFTPLRNNNDRDVLVRGQRPIVRPTAENIGARLVEDHMGRNLAISRNRVWCPHWRPRRICSGACVFPSLDLRWIERDLTRTSIDKPGNMQSQVFTDSNSSRGSSC